jgi:hypothetical protein
MGLRFRAVRLALLVAGTLVIAMIAGVPRAQAAAPTCFNVSVLSPTPFLGNDGELVQLSDGTIWQVKYEYQYMYQYYPSAVICPAAGRLIVDGQSLNVELIGTSNRGGAVLASPARAITVVFIESGCDYFIADGPRGLYLLEWYRGRVPEVGDAIIGEIGGYGFKDVFYPGANSAGRVYVEDYLLSDARAVEKYAEKCG